MFASEQRDRRRLEGAWEVLEVAAGRYESSARVLLSSRWRRELGSRPDLLDAIRSHEPSVSAATQNASLLVSREPQGAAARLLSRVEAARAELRRTAAARLRWGEAAPLEEVLAKLSARVLSEVPSGMQPGERPVLSGAANRFASVLPSLLSILVASAVVPRLLDLSLPVSALLTVAALVGLRVAGLLPHEVRSGTNVLTNRRLIWHPRAGQPVQVPLATLAPSSVKLAAWPIPHGLGAVEVDALEPFTMRWVSNARTLVEYVELLRSIAVSGMPRLKPSLAELRLQIRQATAEADAEERRNEEARSSLLAVLIPNDGLRGQIDRFDRGPGVGIWDLVLPLFAVAGMTISIVGICGPELLPERQLHLNRMAWAFGGIPFAAFPWVVKELWDATLERRAKARRCAIIGRSGSKKPAPAPVYPLAEGDRRLDLLEESVGHSRARIAHHEVFLRQERSRKITSGSRTRALGGAHQERNRFPPDSAAELCHRQSGV
ncbi:MAG: hypothetical protein ACYC8T_23745 [Myxococcaceae bacterium]